MVNKNRVVSTFVEYVKIDSPSKSEHIFASVMVRELEALGFSVSIDKSSKKTGLEGGNVIAKKSGSKPGNPILFCLAMDTAHPMAGIEVVVQEDLVKSHNMPLTPCDNKIPIASLIEALHIINETHAKHPDIEIILTVGERVGFLGLKHLNYKGISSKQAFVFDQHIQHGHVGIASPAQDAIDVTIYGRPAHAGVCPEQGISAIQVAARAIDRMDLLRIDAETTANIGSIQGGIATNIVTPEVIVKAEARSYDHDKLVLRSNRMRQCFTEAAKEFGATVDVKIERLYNPFSIPETDPIVLASKIAIASVGTQPMITRATGGNSANILNSKGIKTVNIGIGGSRPDITHHVSIDQISKTTQLMLSLMTQ